jgi:iron complex transport system ATP-binding protein
MAGWSRREIARRVAYVPQTLHLPFPYRVDEFVALGRLPRSGLFRRLTRRDQALVEATLARLGITQLSGRLFTELSGGQRQLCLIARALVQEATLIVMDEPDTGLDYGNQWRLIALVRELAAEGRAFLLSTHHPEHALNGASRALLLHDGRVVATGEPAAVVSAAHIDRLYGLRVNCHKLPGGQVVVTPHLESETAYA